MILLPNTLSFNFSKIRFNLADLLLRLPGPSHPSPQVYALGLTDSDSPTDPDDADAQPILLDNPSSLALDCSSDLLDDTCDLDF